MSGLERLAVNQGSEIIQVNRRDKIIHHLEHRIFSKDPQGFLLSLERSHHLGMLTIYSISELSLMDICKVFGYHVGFAIKDTGRHREIVGIHNNEFSVHGLGQYIVAAAIIAGGNALDHFGSQKLNQLYESMGFKELRREPYDASYDPDGTFRAKYGELPVIYRVLVK